MSLHTSRFVLARAPVLGVHQGSRQEALRRGVVLFFHGLGGGKEVHERELRLFADQGLFAVGVDAVGHGERRFPDFDARFADGNPRWLEEFLDVVESTANEVPALIDALIGEHGADPARLGIGGVSLGGYITYAALVREQRLRAAVPFLGSPEWGLPRPASPHHHPQRFFPTALFSQTGGKDDVVPPGPAKALHVQLTPLYAEAPERLRHREFPESGHMMREADWQEATRDAADWLSRFILR
ncbi:alpha/beta hydrolase family protein [Corallococcus exiguus]|uniref:Dienelactone hydrolase domain-containing protein n=1 Tax=Corallococcus exiguus TaxID=83462 RepID=A0A7X4YAL2_9BACT|nr:dienelactone hydrolase family protein [Corallococcus exiguus]NBC41681.1 hypothetical protein [Corallococcus exiguus]TNV67479.1 hypothetical protein FH620_00980 [Corallococcus exiguus]